MRTLSLIGGAALVFALQAAANAQQADKKPKKHPNQVVDTGQPAEPTQIPAPDSDSKSFGPRTGEGVTLYFHGNGRVTAFLDESYEEATVARRTPDGTLRSVCVHGAVAASAHVRKPVPQAPVRPVLEEKE